MGRNLTKERRNFVSSTEIYSQFNYSIAFLAINLSLWLGANEAYKEIWKCGMRNREQD